VQTVAHQVVQTVHKICKTSQERHPTGTNNDKLLELMRVTRSNHRAWIMGHQPTITDIIQSYPHLIDS